MLFKAANYATWLTVFCFVFFVYRIFASIFNIWSKRWQWKPMHISQLLCAVHGGIQQHRWKKWGEFAVIQIRARPEICLQRLETSKLDCLDLKHLSSIVSSLDLKHLSSIHHWVIDSMQCAVEFRVMWFILRTNVLLGVKLDTFDRKLNASALMCVHMYAYVQSFCVLAIFRHLIQGLTKHTGKRTCYSHPLFPLVQGALSLHWSPPH